MKSSMVATILAFAIYLVILIVIGIKSYGKNSDADDYFLAGRQLGPWFTALSAEASDMSGWLLMGLPGLACFLGLKEAFWTALGLSVGTYLNWLFVAKRLRKYSIHAGNSITIPEYLTNRFHDEKHILSTIASILILIFFTVYTASGFLTCAKLFNSVFGLSYPVALLLGVAVILGYTLLGGFLAVVSTDFIQGILMFIALISTVLFATAALGGFDKTYAAVASIGQEFITPFAKSGPSFGFMQIVSALAWGLGYCGMPHILVRFMAIRSNKEIKTSRRIAMVWVVIALIAALLMGVIGHAFLAPTTFASQAEAEKVFIISMQRLFPAFIAGIFLCGILAASMSTADSQLLVAASAFSKDVYKALLRKDASDKETLLVSRITVLTVALIAGLLAMDPTSSIFDVVSYAWAGFGASFGPVILLSLFWKKASREGAIAGMISGFVTVVIWKQLSGGIFDVYELLPGFIIALLVMLVIGLVRQDRQDPMVAGQFDEFLAIKDSDQDA
ncbi:MAG: sodium/proline symporter PutP [Spirochaetia bacterium]|jgi:sodium/proline symporter|nr:sodium/proline symporter PutP [Spirochaetia bacterium]